MSKIVCDVCGSTYSETEAQCPICGTAKSEAAKPIVEANAEEQSAKGGKFSRPAPRKTANGSPRRSGSEKNKEEGAPSNMAMIIIVAVLLLAIVSVCVFIAVRLINRPDQPDPSGSSSSNPPVVQTIPCTGIELVGNPDNSLSFTDMTQTAQLNVKAMPENTTDTVTYTYSSSDPAVVTVDNTGLVTPVANGTATITVAYGSYTISVSVTCDIPAPITEIKLSTTEITFNPNNGWTWTITTGELDPFDIVWTSSDETVAYVENGVVTAVGNGNAVITAAYGDLSATCKIIVRDMNVETGFELACTWGAKNDITMKEGEKVKIFLLNKQTNQTVPGLTWEPSPDFAGGCASFVVTDEGIEVTALKTTNNVSGKYVYIQTVHEGVQYRFIIRINPATTEE